MNDTKIPPKDKLGPGVPLSPKEREAMLDAEMRVHGKKLEALDQTLVACIARRMDIARQVLASKVRWQNERGPEIVLRQKERKRVEEVGKLAEQLGVEPSLVKAIEYLLIGESVKVQTEGLFNWISPYPPSRQELTKNLLTLTTAVAEKYGKPAENHGSCPATEALVEFETAMIKGEIDKLDGQHGLIVDIGCANGGELLRHVERFIRGIGFDISPAMISSAIKNHSQTTNVRTKERHNCNFICLDIEDHGIPIKNGEASFVFMNNGTGSDFFDLKRVLGEVSRILRPRGRFFASFYNASAVASAHGTLPWVSAFRAALDRDRGTLCVRSSSGQTFEIQGRAYTQDEVEAVMPNNLRLMSSWSYPHALSLMPPGFLAANPEFRRAIEVLDGDLADRASGGAYLIVSGIKI